MLNIKSQKSLKIRKIMGEKATSICGYEYYFHIFMNILFTNLYRVSFVYFLFYFINIFFFFFEFQD